MDLEDEPLVAAPGHLRPGGVAVGGTRGGREVRRRSTRRHWRQSDKAWVAAIVVASVVVSTFAEAAPTGHGAIDLVERALFAGGLTLLAARARRWTWVLAAVVAAALCRLPSAWFGFGAIVAALLGTSRTRREPVLGAAAGALAAQGLLRMELPRAFGATAAITALVAVVVAVSAYGTARPQNQRVVRWVVAGVVAVVVVVGAVAAVSVLSVRSDVEDGVRTAARGLDRAQASSSGDGLRLLEQARDQFARASDRTNAVWMLPAHLVPVLAQHVHAVSTLTRDGRDLADRAAQVARAVDIDDLRRADGSLDLQLIAHFHRPLERSAVAVTGALRDLRDVRSSWLVGPLVDRIDDFQQRIGRLAPNVALTADAARYLPGLLGGSTPRHYFVALVTPSETRDIGGHMGNWAEISATDGRFDVVRSGRTELLGPQAVAGRVLHDPDTYPTSFVSSRPALFPQNWGATADLRTVARAVGDLYPQSGGEPIDGVAVVDPYGFAALLKLTGPVTAPGGPTLDATNAAKFLLEDQYTAFPDETTRGDYLTRLVDTAIGRLRTGGASSPRQVVSALASAVHAHQLEFISTRPGEARFLSDADLVPTVRRPATGDQLALLSTNLAPNKMDAYVHRDVHVALSIDAGGHVVEQVDVTLTNQGPTIGPPELVGNRQGMANGTVVDRLSAVTPLQLDDVRIDGAEGTVAPEAEFGLNRYGVTFAIPNGGSVTVQYSLRGKIPRDSAYRLAILRQPLAHDDHVTVSVTSTAGDDWGLSTTSGPGKTGARTVAFDLERDTVLTFERP
jgi:hypothetical protein